MITNQKIKNIWNPSIRKHYEEKGYLFTKYGDEFEVDFEDIPHSSDKFVECTCDYCGKKYEIQVKKYYRSMNSTVPKLACKSCQGIKGSETKIIKYGTASPNIHEQVKEKWLKRNVPLKQETLNKMIATFKENDCVMMPSIYVNNETKMPYICKKHINRGIQWNNWIHLKSGRGCYYCGEESRVEKQKYSVEEIRSEIESNGKNKLLSNHYNTYNSYDLEISCEDCGKPFITSFNWFRRGKTKCNECTCSIGERLIIEYLNTHSIEYEHDCHEIYSEEWDNPLRFDFYLNDYNTAIEFDGEQHFKPVDFNGEGIEIATKKFYECVFRDKVKNKYCIKNNIFLIRIPYWERDNMEDILDNYFNNNDLTYVVNYKESRNNDSLLLCSNE